MKSGYSNNKLNIKLAGKVISRINEMYITTWKKSLFHRWIHNDVVPSKELNKTSQI